MAHNDEKEAMAPVTYSEMLGDALKFAADAHASQKRKGKDEPYLSHLLLVASLVMHYGGDEEQVIAGVLHDAVEDQGGMAMAAEIRARYGDRVADIVLDCSDAAPEPGQAKAPWKQRKLAYVESIRAAGPNDARLVEACDKIANMRDIAEDVAVDGDAVFDRFKGGKTGTLEYYATLQETLIQQVDIPAVRAEYDRLFQQLLALSQVTEVRTW